jgi:hypothetical protein
MVHPEATSRSTTRSRALISSVLFLMLACALGCGEGQLKTYPVQGKVLFADGSPVKLGTIECLSETHGIQATGTIHRDGTFRLKTYRDEDGAVEGLHKCVIVQFIQADGIPNHKPSTLGVINKRHASYATSGLSIRVDPDTSKNQDIVLQVEGVDGRAGSSNHSKKDEHRFEHKKENEDDQSKKSEPGQPVGS